MSDPSRANSEPATRFFDNYLEIVHKHAIPAKRSHWYVKYVEAFIKAQNDRLIKLLAPLRSWERRLVTFPCCRSLCLRVAASTSGNPTRRAV